MIRQGALFGPDEFANLFAVYLPAAFWVPGLPGTTTIGWKFLLSPVAFILLGLNINNSVVELSVLTIFLMSLCLYSGLLLRFKVIWILWTTCGLSHKPAQGMLFARIVHGINGLSG